VKSETGIKDRMLYRCKLGDYLTVALELAMMISLTIEIEKFWLEKNIHCPTTLPILVNLFSVEQGHNPCADPA
jgi:hypothetical protein